MSIRRPSNLAALSVAIYFLAASPADASVRVEVEEDSTRTVALVAWHSDDYVLCVDGSGLETYIGTHKVRKIWDEEGVDRTRDVIEKRKTVGTPPPGYQGMEGRGRLKVGNALVIVAAVTMIFLLGAYGSTRLNW